jgi:hypothetical protein
MRKTIGLNVAVLVIAMVLTSGTTFAANTGNGAVSGPHWNINFIGRPIDKGIGGDDSGADYSGGHSIMIPLKNVSSPGEITCLLDGVHFVDDVYPNKVDAVPTTGARIYFEGDDHFEISDRDAMDGSATIKVPVEATGEFKFEVYMRVLGKPNPVSCMNINAYAQDAQDSSTWYGAGTVTVRRAKGKSTFVRVTDLFTSWFCTEWNITHTTCLNTANLSVFSDVFQAYFWQILNDGVKLVQVRIYPTDTVYVPPTSGVQ